jgi:hypothetical protein
MGIADDMKILTEDIVASYGLRVKTIRDIEKDTHDMLKGFQSEHKKMAADLRKTLAKEEADRLKENVNLMNQFQAEDKDRIAEGKDRNKEVLDLLKEFSTEREKMAASWQALTAAMAKKSSIKPKVAADVKVRPVKEVIEVKEVKEVKEAAEEIKEDKPSSEMDLEGKVLGFIRRHPEGVRVGEMEEPLGVLRMRLGVIAKVLLEKGKVRKEENVYFPIL